MKCPKCEAELSEDTKYCSYCGTKIESDEPKVSKSPELKKESTTHSTIHKLPEMPKADIGSGASNTGKITTAASNRKRKTPSNNRGGYGKFAAIGLVILIILCLVVHAIKTKLDDRTTASDLNGITSDDIPEELGTLDWPDSEMTKLIPPPKSSVGKIFQDDKAAFSAIIGETSLDDYHNYVQECIEKGFDVEADQGDQDFSAMNVDRYKLTVKYTEPDRMQIDMAEPEYEINIEVNCNKNLIFSKYDVEIFVDDISEGVLEHGEKDTYSTILNRGTHTIKFVSEEDDTVDGTAKIKARKNQTFQFEITCSNSQIDVVNLADEAKKKTEKKKSESDEENDPAKMEEPVADESKAEDMQEEHLTIDNCPELAAMLTNKADIDESYSVFASTYAGRVIEFDGRIDYCVNHGKYKTRFDYLVSAGDYDPDHQIGPAFKFEDVNYNDLNTDLGTVRVGQNVHIAAEVESFDSDSGLFYLDPIEVTGR